jgi:hypothetical protein
MKLSVVIYSRSTLRREELMRELNPLRPDYPELLIMAFDMSLVSGLRDKPQAVILDYERSAPGDWQALFDLRRNGYQGPVILLSGATIDNNATPMLRTNVFFYDDNKGTRDLVGIVRRLIAGAVVAARKHPRHRVDEPARVQVQGQGYDHGCRVRNISKGGAMVEVDKLLSIRPGMILKIFIHLQALGRFHKVNARVAWSDRTRFGIEFVVKSKKSDKGKKPA